MPRTPPRSLVAGLVLAGTLAPVACATRSGVAAPLPFPGARPAPAAAPGPSALALPPGELLVQTALDLLGVPYRLGGDDPATGVDCSGFTRWVYARHAIDLPRTAADQHRLGAPVALADVRAGDLVFFTTIAPGASHVGLALGGGEFIHAPADGGVVRVERLSAPYWRERFLGARRLVGAPAAATGRSAIA